MLASTLTIISYSTWLRRTIQLYLAMHVPDGFLNLPVIVVTWAIAIVVIAISLWFR